MAKKRFKNPAFNTARLRKVFKTSGLTYQQFALDVGLPNQQMLHRWVNHGTTPGLGAAVLLAQWHGDKVESWIREA